MFRGGLFGSGVLSRLVGGEGRDVDGSGGGVTGKPSTTDANTKHFERGGWEIVELPLAEIPTVSNEREGVAFCVIDVREPLEDTIRTSKSNSVFVRERDDFQLSLGDHFDGGGQLFKAEDEATGCELRGLDVDTSERGKGAKLVINRGGGTIRDVTFRGEMDGVGDWPAGVYLTLEEHGEKATLEGLRLIGGASRNGGVKSTHDSIGVLLDGRSNSPVELKDCRIDGMPNNGLYASGPSKRGNDGYAIVEGGTFKNSDRDQLRVGGRSRIRGAHCYSDRIKPGFNNLRGIWARFARGVTIEDVTIEQLTNDHGPAVYIDSTAGRVDFRDSEVRLESQHHAARGIWADEPDEEAVAAGAALTVDNVRFWGAGKPRDVILLERRHGSTINADFDMEHETEHIDRR